VLIVHTGAALGGRDEAAGERGGTGSITVVLSRREARRCDAVEAEQWVGGRGGATGRVVTCWSRPLSHTTLFLNFTYYSIPKLLSSLIFFIYI
jgi:hypothetical protein